MKRTCNKEGHQFSRPNGVGAGILRSSCTVCGWVTIDLSSDVSVLRPLVRIRDRKARSPRSTTDLLVSGAASS